MNFIYSIFIGVFFALFETPTIYAIPALLFLVSGRAIKDIIFKKDFFTGTPSQFQLYISNINKSNLSTKRASVKYFLQSLLIDGVLSITAFFIVQLLFSNQGE